MGYNYWRHQADSQGTSSVEDADQIIKYNVLPTVASGTFVFCLTMFATWALPYDFVSIILSFVMYTVLMMVTLGLAMNRRNTAALVSFYALCVATGFMQRPVILFAYAYLGSFAEVRLLFAAAVVAATGVLVAMWLVTRTFPQLFSPGSGFMRMVWWIPMFLVLGTSIWLIIALITGQFDLYLLVSSMVGVLIAGLYTMVAIQSMRSQVQDGRWVFSAVYLSINYFILIVRIFLIMVLARGRR